MNVNVFTRHRVTCPHRTKSAYNKCFCPKFLHWYAGGKLYKRTAKTDSYDVALQRAQEQRQALETGRPTSTSVTVAHAVTAYLDDKRSQHLAGATLAKLNTIFEKGLQTYCDENGVVTIDSITLEHLQAWRRTWKDGALAGSKKQERVKGFFHFCIRLGWVRSNPALGMSRIKVIHQPTESFTENEMQRILVGAQDERSGIKLHALINLMRWSGLAIRDAVTLERSRLNDEDEVFLHRAKTGVPVTVVIPPDVAKELRSIENSNPNYFFWSGNGLAKSCVADYQRALRRLFKKINLTGADGKPKRCHSHQFRNTFSVSLLMVGVPIHDVALLLGHSSVKTTEKAYAPFVMSRRDNLLDAARSAWNTKGQGGTETF